MTAMHVPFEIFELLERRLGREDAMQVAKSIETSMSHVAERSKEIASQRKLEVKDELRKEMLDELATNADIAELKGDIENVRLATKTDIARSELAVKEDINTVKSDISRLELSLVKQDKKTTIQFIVLAAMIVLLNKEALNQLAALLHLVK
ncbi:hypothetical protein [Diaphorobacter sp. J5-51]|uniref:hypothetical protein n=1 Tax=Diaphorobacter sp. J5-51 TaxID=680496 RepID=UPI000643777D|nr:hypothetical protein [Diaphorobacter sp. J5-51]KLR59293.1 hypothetical protein OX89_02540 [Diaphorobacter sp. J5-51]